MALLEQAISIACLAHAGQNDKAGKAYIEHVLRVIVGCDSYVAKVAAALHDVIEDCPKGKELLDAGDFPADIVESVSLLTKKHGESYETYIGKIAANSVAREVKMSDLRDNMDMTRIDNPKVADDERLIRRMGKYAWAYAVLLRADRAAKLGKIVI